MKRNLFIIGKFLYAILFIIIIPSTLWFWAEYTEHLIQLPVIESKTAGWILAITGWILGLLGMYTLKKYGKGLPMSAYPPTKFVTRGIYRIIRHPIYWSFGLFIIGCSILAESASGLWLICPLTIVSMIAFVLGYEQIDLKKKFPNESVKAMLDLPEKTSENPDFRDRFISLFWLAILLLISNFIIAKLTGNIPALFGKPLTIQFDFTQTYLPFFSVILIGITPFLLKRKDLLREWAFSGIIALCISNFIALLYPSVGAQYLPVDNFVIITTPIYLLLLSLKSIVKQSRQLGYFFGILTIILIIIQLTNCRSAALHFISSIFIFLISANYFRIWIYLKNCSEKIANSWKEWVFGKVRVINHGFYMGFSVFFGIILSGFLVGNDYAWPVLIFAVTLIVFSALWAQIIEGSKKLKRPYGYYGALVGVIFASGAVWAMGFNVWIIIGVNTVVMTWLQAIGRLRCLVNGCCHGSQVDNPNIGIRYFHQRSRVCVISGLKGKLIHPTQLYAILWLFLIGFILLNLWNHKFSPPFIFGIYLILTGIGRFVEEAYRGEVQTPIIKGLRLYQWTAILSIIIGIIMTIIQVDVVIIKSDFGLETFFAAIIGGLFATFAMGVDFPNSNTRFSRLV